MHLRLNREYPSTIIAHALWWLANALFVMLLFALIYVMSVPRPGTAYTDPPSSRGVLSLDREPDGGLRLERLEMRRHHEICLLILARTDARVRFWKSERQLWGALKPM